MICPRGFFSRRYGVGASWILKRNRKENFMSLAIALVTYKVPSANETKDAINKQFAERSLKIALDILENGSWLVPTPPWSPGTLSNHLDAIISHDIGYDNARQYDLTISEYKNDNKSKDIDVDNTKEKVLLVSVLNMHENVYIALIVDLFFKAIVGISALVFVVTLLPISAIPLSASAIAGKAFGVAAVAYAARSAWNIAYPPGKEVAEKIQTLLTTDLFWKKVLAQ